MEGEVSQSDSVAGAGSLNKNGQMVIRNDSGDILVDLRLSEELLKRS